MESSGPARCRPRAFSRRCPTNSVPARTLAPPCGGRLELAGHAGLQVMPLLTDFLEDARLLDLTLEDLDGPLDPIGLTQDDFDHRFSLGCSGPRGAGEPCA